MNGSQLQVEFEAMPDRHELYAKYGITAEAAQLFETELGTLLLSLRGFENGWHLVPDEAAARAVLETIDQSTLGRVLNGLKRHIPIEGDLEESFSSALRARNRLMHGFFERHDFKIQTEDGRREMIEDLDSMHGELFAAWQVASDLTSIISAALRITARGEPGPAD